MPKPVAFDTIQRHVNETFGHILGVSPAFLNVGPKFGGTQECENLLLGKRLLRSEERDILVLRDDSCLHLAEI